MTNIPDVLLMGTIKKKKQTASSREMSVSNSLII